MKEKKRKVLLVGWDAADWQVIDKLMANGLMPAFKSVVDRGVRGRLATLDPPLSPMLWTSMATGVRPYKHGISGFVENDGSGGVRPITSYSRKVNAFWNIFTKEGLKSNVVGWWPSNPVETINGVMVSNRFQQEKDGKETVDLKDWKIEPGTIHPEKFVKKLEEFRIHPSEITGNLVMPFVPRALELDKKEDKRLTVIAKFLAHSGSLHAVSTELLETTEWDITAVYHDALDHFCHGFMKFHPPKMEGMEQEAYELFKDVVTGAYVYHDMMLARLLSIIDDDTTIIICSDHGFHSDHLRPTKIPQVPSGPAVEHAPFGVFVAAGPGIKKGEHVHGASILDVTPTLLTLFDLPIGRDMDGKPLMDIYETPKACKYIESWENDERFGGELVINEKPDEGTNAAALQQLIDLGYIDDVQIKEGENNEAVQINYLNDVLRENNFYMAKAYANGHKFDEALEILLEIEKRDKPDIRYLIEIVTAAIKTKRFPLAEEYITFIRKNKLAQENFLDVLDGKVQLGLNNPTKALMFLERAVENYPESAGILVDLGKILNTLNESEKAKKIFKAALTIDPQNVYAQHGFGLACMRLQDYETALEYFLNATEQYYHYPLAHMHLGETLALMKEYEMAKSSFEVVVAIAPTLPKAYRWLQDLNEITGDDEKANYYKSIIGKFELGERTIITGLPGGKLIEVMDHIVSKGQTIYGAKDMFGKNLNVLKPDWIKDISEDIVYVPIGMLGSLPVKFSYKILFVNDTIDSVSNFMNIENKKKAKTYNPKLLESLSIQSQKSKIWMSQQPNLDIIYLNSLEEIQEELFKLFVS